MQLLLTWKIGNNHKWVKQGKKICRRQHKRWNFIATTRTRKCDRMDCPWHHSIFPDWKSRFYFFTSCENAIDFINALSKEQFQTLSCKATENIIIKTFHYPIIAKHLMNSSGDFENYRFLNGEDAQGKGAQWDQYNPLPEELFQLVTSCWTFCKQHELFNTLFKK